MRLTETEVSKIKSLTHTIVWESKIYIFGSRIDETKEGGDIDIFLIPKSYENMVYKQYLLKSKLEDSVFKPIDIVVANNLDTKIEEEALKGIEI